jgi:hypothetical protein
VVHLLLDCGANPHAMNIFTHTPLDTATNMGVR